MIFSSRKVKIWRPSFPREFLALSAIIEGVPCAAMTILVRLRKNFTVVARNLLPFESPENVKVFFLFFECVLADN